MLMTASVQLALKHRLQAPHTSDVPADPLLATALPRASTPSKGMPALTPPHQPSSVARLGSRGRPLETPTALSGANLFGSVVGVCSPPLHRSSQSQTVLRAASTSHPAHFPSPLSVKPKWEEITSWNLLSRPARNACAREFLMLCLCVTHGPAHLDLFHADCRKNHSFSQPGKKTALRSVSEPLLQHSPIASYLL
jgi:hypothetical protein